MQREWEEVYTPEIKVGELVCWGNEETVQGLGGGGVGAESAGNLTPSSALMIVFCCVMNIPAIRARQSSASLLYDHSTFNLECAP